MEKPMPLSASSAIGSLIKTRALGLAEQVGVGGAAKEFGLRAKKFIADSKFSYESSTLLTVVKRSMRLNGLAI